MQAVRHLFRQGVLHFEVCLWSGLVLTLWLLLFDKSLEPETCFQYLTKIQICFLVGFFFCSVKTLTVKALVSRFHARTYFDRIKKSLFNQIVIETLFQKNDRALQFHTAVKTAPADLENSALSTEKREIVIGIEGPPRGPSLPGKSMKLSGSIRTKGDDEGIAINHLQKLSTENVCAWDMNRMTNIVQHQTISTFDEQNLGATSRKEGDSETKIRREGKAAARKIFSNVARHGSNSILLDDLRPFLGEEAAKNFFDLASDGTKISESSLNNFVAHALKERKALASTLNDIEAIINKLDTTANIIIAISVIVVFIFILELVTTKYILFGGVLVMAAAALTGNTAKTAFENVIYLFITHPFDVGDWCEIDQVQLTVEKMNIMTTVFRTYDHEHTMIQNSVLSTKSIINYNRSTDMIDSFEFCVLQSTPAEKIAALRERILTYVEGKKEHWYPNPRIVVKELEPSGMGRYEVQLTTRMSHQDMDDRLAMRGSFIEEIVKILQDLNIESSRHGR